MNNILIIDDDEVSRFLIKRILMKDTKYIFFEAKNGKDALDICIKNQISLIICDVEMPDMNGIDFVKILRSRISIWQEIPIIMISAYTDISFIHQCLDAGCDDYLFKPIIAHELKDLVKARITRSTNISKVKDKQINDIFKYLTHSTESVFFTKLKALCKSTIINRFILISMEKMFNNYNANDIEVMKDKLNTILEENDLLHYLDNGDFLIVLKEDDKNKKKKIKKLIPKKYFFI